MRRIWNYFFAYLLYSLTTVIGMYDLALEAGLRIRFYMDAYYFGKPDTDPQNKGQKL
jgi:hypothetical protein